MPDYSKGKIYQIISPNHPLPYIGSTTSLLCKRMAGHRTERKTKSRIVIDAGDAYIELIEEYPCENKEQLNRREGEVIRSRDCVNKQVAGRTGKEYREENKDTIDARSKAFYIANREALIARSRAYRQANKEAINAKKRANRAKKNEVISITE